jgi:hypothetical protein
MVNQTASPIVPSSLRWHRCLLERWIVSREFDQKSLVYFVALLGLTKKAVIEGSLGPFVVW